jgi:hypothetical protein
MGVYIIVQQNWQFDDAMSQVIDSKENLQAYHSKENAEKDCMELNLEAFKDHFFSGKPGNCVNGNAFWAYLNRQAIPRKSWPKRNLSWWPAFKDYFIGYQHDLDLKKFLESLGLKPEFKNNKLLGLEHPFPIIDDDKICQFITACHIKFYRVQEIETNE